MSNDVLSQQEIDDLMNIGMPGDIEEKPEPIHKGSCAPVNHFNELPSWNESIVYLNGSRYRRRSGSFFLSLID